MLQLKVFSTWNVWLGIFFIWKNQKISHFHPSSSYLQDVSEYLSIFSPKSNVVDTSRISPIISRNMNRQVMDIRKACNPVKDKQLALKNNLFTTQSKSKNKTVYHLYKVCIHYTVTYLVGYASSASGSLFRRNACSGSLFTSSKDICGMFLYLHKQKYWNPH